VLLVGVLVAPDRHGRHSVPLVLSHAPAFIFFGGWGTIPDEFPPGDMASAPIQVWRGFPSYTSLYANPNRCHLDWAGGGSHG
jgi:hypothetical protein